MTITLTRTKLAIAVLAVVLLVPATAYATHVFDDVPDTAFYAGPVEWAFDNEITTGKSPTEFAPLDGVTRGESVTFLQRYNDNIVEPATIDLFASETRGDSFVTVPANPTDLGLSPTVIIPEGRTGVIEVVFNSATSCGNGGVGGFCEITIKNNGTAIGGEKQVIDSSDNGDESGNAWESHSIVRVTDELPAGSYTFTVEASEGTGSPVMSTRFATVTAQVHLTS
jgi:hypothetical protein